MGAAGLLFEEDGGEPPGGNIRPRLTLPDFPVLAEGAPQGAVGEKDRPAAPFPRDAGLLPEVEGGPGHPDGFPRSPAEPLFPGETVDPAHPGAEGAAAEERFPFFFHCRLLSGRGHKKPRRRIHLE